MNHDRANLVSVYFWGNLTKMSKARGVGDGKIREFYTVTKAGVLVKDQNSCCYQIRIYQSYTFN